MFIYATGIKKKMLRLGANVNKYSCYCYLAPTAQPLDFIFDKFKKWHEDGE